MVFAHFPEQTLRRILKTNPHHSLLLIRTDLHLCHIVSQHNALEFTLVEMAVDNRPILENNEPNPMHLVEFEEPHIQFVLFCEDDSEAISLVGTVDEALVDGVDEVDVEHLVVIEYIFGQGVCVCAFVVVFGGVVSGCVHIIL